MDIMRSCNLHYDGVDSAYLDCLDDNLAVLLKHVGVTDLRAPFACQWYFDFDPSAPAASVERAPVEELIRQQTGYLFRQHQFEAGRYVERCAEFLQREQPLLVFGDAYFMPWLPYFAREHMEHSLLVDGLSDDQRLFHVVDAYYNHTPYGLASPTATYLPAMALERIAQALDTPNAGTFLVIEAAGTPTPIDPATRLLSNAEQMLAQLQERAALERFRRFYAERAQDAAAIKAFTLDCWLIARARALHRLWLSDVARQYPDVLDAGFPDIFQQDVVAPWQKVAEYAYICLRRVSQGRAAPDACFKMLEQTVAPNEIRVAELLAQTAARQPTSVGKG